LSTDSDRRAFSY